MTARSGTIETAHHIIALLQAKQRTAPELARLTEAGRGSVGRHLRSLRDHQLVTAVQPGGWPAPALIYRWVKE